MVGILVLLTVVLLLAVDHLLLKMKGRKAWPWQEEKAIREYMLACQPDRFYAANHTWFLIDHDGSARLGVDEFLLHLLGKPERIELVAGGKVEKGDALLRLTVGERSLTISAPFAASVAVINQKVFCDTSCLLETGNEESWVLRLEPESAGEAALHARIADRATSWLQDELNRFKEFALRSVSPAMAVSSSPDGGEVVKGVLCELEADAWKKFQQEFTQS